MVDEIGYDQYSMVGSLRKPAVEDRVLPRYDRTAWHRGTGLKASCSCSRASRCRRRDVVGALHNLNGWARIVEATRRYMPIVVEFDPDFMLVSMEMWRKSLDMQIPIADEFKIHFMENRRRLLVWP